MPELLLCFLEMTSAQQIYPVKVMENGVSGKEGESVTLICKYTTTSSYVYLYWYKHQAEHVAPQFILWKGARSISSEHIPDKRYTCKTDYSKSELTITEVTLSDTAVYYCALDTQ